MPTLNDRIVAYLDANAIAWDVADFATGQPEGQPDQVLAWNAAKLGAMPDDQALDDAYAAALLNRQKAEVRLDRDARLAATDWRVIKALETGVPMSAEWQAYRQALRDISQQPGFPGDVTWPVQPA